MQIRPYPDPGYRRRYQQQEKVFHGLNQPLGNGELGQSDNATTFQGRLGGEKSNTGPIRGLAGVWERFTIFEHRHKELER